MRENSSNKKEEKINFFINNDPEWGGTYQYTELLIKAIELKYKKKNIKYFYTKKIWENNISTNNYFLGLGIFQMMLIQILISINSKKLNKLLKKINILHLPNSFFDKNEYWIFPSQDLISVLCEGKTIVSINDLMHRYSNFPETSSFFRRLYRDYKFKKIAKFSYRVLVDSSLGKKQVEESYGVFNNLRIQYFSSLITENNNISKNKSEKYLIYPAQFWNHKNHYNLVVAINILKKKFKDIKLILIGHKKRNYNKIFDLVRSLKLEKNVIFLGYVDDQKKAELYLNARALVNPSFLGPTNIPQLEAFNYSCPVVVSNVFATREQCGDSVLYFDPEYVDSIVISIKKVWESEELYNLYKKKSYSIAQKYSLENFSKRLIKNIFSDLSLKK